MPDLALPFLFVGGAAGWLTAVFLANPLVSVTNGGEEPTAAIIAALVSAAVGRSLSRWCSTRLTWHGPEALLGRMAATMMLGGALAGAATAVLHHTSPGNLAAGGFEGALAGAAFLPVGALVVAAARRAERARHGSLVASSDRRAVWGILATALGVATAIGLLDWPFAGRLYVTVQPSPDAAVGMLAVAAAVVVLALFADLLALRRIRTAGLESRDDAVMLEVGGAEQLDLGLGGGVLAKLARGAAVYRGRERAVAMVLGDPEQARAALRAALRRGGVGLALLASVGLAHAYLAANAASLFPEEPAVIAARHGLFHWLRF